MEEKEIGELFRENLSDFQGSIPGDGWQKIQKDPAVKKITRPYRVKKAIWITAATIAVVGVAALAFIAQTPKQTAEQTNIPTTKQVVVSPEISSVGLANENNALAPSHNNLSRTEVESNETSPVQNVQKNEAILAHPLEMHEINTHGSSHPIVKEETIIAENRTTEIQAKPQSASQSPSQNHTKTLKTDGTETALRYSGDTSVCKNSPVTLYVENALNVRWSTGMQDKMLTIIPEEPTMIYAQVEKLDKSDTVIYFQIDVFDCELFIPSAFTPNGDGLNDEFIVYAPMEIAQFECVIFDKASRVLFQTKSIQQGWDGTFEGRPLPSGGYFYVIKFRDRLNEQHIQKGQVVLVR